VLLISGDRRLANQMAQTCNTQVECLHPAPYIVWMRESGKDFQSEEDARSVVPSIQRGRRRSPYTALYLDTGSLAAWAMKLTSVQGADGEEVFRRTPLGSYVDSDDRRHVRYVRETIPERDRKLRTRPYRPVRQPRLFPHLVGPSGDSSQTGKSTRASSTTWSTTRSAESLSSLPSWRS
jgi:hypothetical protein